MHAHPPICGFLDLIAVDVHYGIGVEVLYIDVVISEVGASNIEIFFCLQIQVPRRHVEIEGLMSDLLDLPEMVGKQDHQVVIRYLIFVGRDGPVEFNDEVIVLVDSDFNDLGGYICAVVSVPLVSPVAHVVPLSDTPRAAAVPRPLVAVIALEERVAFAVAAGLDAGPRGPNKHIGLVEVLAQLALLLAGQVHPVAARGALRRPGLTGQAVNRTLGAVLLI